MNGSCRPRLPRGRALYPPLIVVLILSLLLGPFAGPWPAEGAPSAGANVGVSVGADDARTPTLAADPFGRFHVTWSSNAAGVRDIYYAWSSDGIAWSPSVPIGALPADEGLPRIAVDSEVGVGSGDLFVVYQAGGGLSSDTYFVKSSDGGTTWDPPQQVDSGPSNTGAMFPDVAATGGRAYVSWSDGRFGSGYQIIVRASLDGGTTWDPEAQLSFVGDNLQARIAAKLDTVAVVWRQATNVSTSISFARSDDAGRTWNLSTVATNATAAENLVSPDVYLDDLATAHVVWNGSTPSTGAHIRYAWSSDGRTWSPPVTVDDAPAGTFARTPSIDGVAGTLWAAWADSRNGDPRDRDIFASWSQDGVTWGDGLANGNDIRVDDTDRNGIPTDDATIQDVPNLATGARGVYLAWEDMRSLTSGDVYFAEVIAPSIVVTEIQDEPAGSARVELYNYARTPFDLTGATLLAGASSVDLTPLGFIPARDHVVIGALSSCDLQVALDLSGEGARVEVQLGGEVIASAGTGIRGIGPDPLPMESSARYAGTLDYTSSWTRDTSPSFGSRNAATGPDLAPPVVLNEVLYNPSRLGEMFVELYDRAGTSVDITGYVLVADDVYTFPSVVLDAGNPYGFLVEVRAPSWFGSVNPPGDNVYLYDASGRLLDMVGWTAPHSAGSTLGRVAEGAGGNHAYDDPTAVANGWAFDRVATLALVDLGPDANITADIGTVEQFALRATNRQSVGEILNVEYAEVLTNWPVLFRWPNGTPLTDSVGDPDVLPDVGLVGPGATVTFLVEIVIPLQGPTGIGNVVTVSASAATMPVARDNATLTVNLYPHFHVSRTVDPTMVYLEGSGPPYNEVAQIAIDIQGEGVPIVSLLPQDVVFQIDVSGSMAQSDGANLRVAAVKSYIDGLNDDDRGAIVGFNNTVRTLAPLTNTDPPGKAILKAAADMLAYADGNTNIDLALQTGNQILITTGNSSRPRVEILLTDGNCNPPCTNTANIVNQAVQNGIIIYTIGLGTGVNPTYLQGIANPTGGRYYFAPTAQDLLAIYQEIALRVNETAGMDVDITDGVPMIQEVVAPYLSIVPGSFVNPATGLARPPDFTDYRADRTILQWNCSRIRIGETWSVRFDVKSSQAGIVDVALYPDARAAYTRWDGSVLFQPIPQGTLEVLVAPSPPYITQTDPVDRATNMSVDTPIRVWFSEAMDAPSVRWTIFPLVTLVPSWPTTNQLQLDHAGLAECTAYTVMITQGRDLAAESLVPGPVPNPWSFSTFCPRTVVYTITRLPEQGYVLVDGATHSVPAAFVWRPGEIHALDTPDFDLAGGSRLAFLSWDDGGARSHNVTVGDVDLTITAIYALQHYATLTLVGLQSSHPANVASTLWGTPANVPAVGAWSSWVDDGSALTVDDLVNGVAGERWATEDPTGWTVTAPLAATVTYVHQYVTTVDFVGLEGHTVALDRTYFGRPVRVAEGDRFSDWSDANRQLSVEGMVSLGTRERLRTLDTVLWTVDAPLDAVVTYLHQYRPRVVLVGPNATHSVGVNHTADTAWSRETGLFGEWFDWADGGTLLVFDNRTMGDPPLEAQDPYSFTVQSAFDATIRYVTPQPPPTPTQPPQPNWKPVLAVVYALVIVVVGVWAGTRPLDRHVPEENERRAQALKAMPLERKLKALTVPEIEEKLRRDRRFTRLVLALPLALAEVLIGLLSLLTGVFRIPDGGNWLPVGFWTNTIILVIGLAASLIARHRGYELSEEDILAIAATRGEAHGTEPEGEALEESEAAPEEAERPGADAEPDDAP